MEPKKKRRVGKTLKLYKNKKMSIELRTGRSPYKYQVWHTHVKFPGFSPSTDRYVYYTDEKAAKFLAELLEIYSKDEWGGPFELVESN
ncbi:MAG: hypothetical protein MPK62_01820 [Alphaproteobacteria bacterium]|nr:hypothetical protein [Alphaproteobacteria bacterium]MDA8029871.1 hypothetical protein [Alphaproteobacteria bacterium]